MKLTRACEETLMKLASIGFSGTRNGMTKHQKRELSWFLTLVDATYFHHGDCIGADEEAAVRAHELGMRLICHPPTNPKLRAHTKFNHTILFVRPYHERNKDIVDHTHLLIACPRTHNLVERSGTWMTIRYALSIGRSTLIIPPEEK